MGSYKLFKLNNMDVKQKYVRLKEYDSFIFFPEVIEHSKFANLNPISAGFCYNEDGVVKCYGESYSLGIKSKEDDTLYATKQVYGVDAMIKIL